MALIVETGAIIANANSYDSLVNIDAYCTARNYTSWLVLSGVDKEAAVLRMMTYLETRIWEGYRVSELQVLSWPRSGVYVPGGFYIEDDVVPSNVKYALAEGAYKESLRPGTMLQDLERGGLIKRKRIDVLETEWFDGAPGGTEFVVIDALLYGLCYSSYNRLQRV
jgi:hypothetical protein